MAKCDCYYTAKKVVHNGSCVFEKEQGICLGTREMFECDCKGDTDNCTFYPEKRKENKMNTAEMWLKAQEDGKYYYTKDVIYQKNKGLVSCRKFIPYVLENINFDTLMKEEWQEYDKNIMTRYEAENKYNIKIID